MEGSRLQIGATAEAMASASSAAASLTPEGRLDLGDLREYLDRFNVLYMVVKSHIPDVRAHCALEPSARFDVVQSILEDLRQKTMRGSLERPYNGECRVRGHV